jgi:hypothetical protein
MILRYAHHKPFNFQLPDRCDWQNWFSPDNKEGLVWYTDRSKTNEVTGVGCKMGSKEGHILQSWVPHHNMPGKNISHQGMHNGEYRKGLQR